MCSLGHADMRATTIPSLPDSTGHIQLLEMKEKDKDSEDTRQRPNTVIGPPHTQNPTGKGKPSQEKSMHMEREEKEGGKK